MSRFNPFRSRSKASKGHVDLLSSSPNTSPWPSTSSPSPTPTQPIVYSPSPTSTQPIVYSQNIATTVVEGPQKKDSEALMSHLQTLLDKLDVNSGFNGDFDPLSPSPPYQSESISYGQTVDIDVNVAHIKKSELKPDTLYLKGVPVPVTFSDVCSRIANAGYNLPTAYVANPERVPVTVTDAPSKYLVGVGGQINIDQPLLLFYHKVFWSKMTDKNTRDNNINEPPPPEYTSMAKINGGKDRVDIGGIGISFRRTVRVPDNDKTHLLPPDMGEFSVYNVADFADRLPGPIVAKGGVFISMYQREAMWSYFTSEISGIATAANPTERAVKISVGGLNALTGRPAEDPAPEGVQDYIPVGGEGGQLWLDGIYTAPNIVRQFVAMPLGQGYTVEGQITGKEDVGGMQVDVYRRLPETVTFYSVGGVELRLITTPRKLGMKTSDKLLMQDKLRGKPELISGNTKQLLPCGPKLEITVDPHVVVVTSNNKTVRVICDIPTTTVVDLKRRVMDLTECFDTLHYEGIDLNIGKTLSDYGITSGAKITMVSRPRRGGVGGRRVVAQTTGYACPPAPAAPGIERGSVYNDEFSGFAAGGRISQKINRNRLPVIAYDPDSGERLHVHVLNAAYFQAITGLPAPPSPINTQTYLSLGLPWYQMFDEHIPRANNAARGAAHALEGVKSIAQLDKERASQGKEVQKECVFCQYQMASIRLVPCGHVVCDDCAEGLEPRACPECPQFVRAREKFAAPMAMPGQEENDGVTVDHIQVDNQTGQIVHANAAVVILRRYAGTGKAISSKLVGSNISGLHGHDA